MTVIQIILKIRLYSMENSLKTHTFKNVKVPFHIIIFNMEFFFIILKFIR